MYKSPVELLVTEIEHQIVKQQDEEIYKAVAHYVPNVNKAELIRALNYDREQYEKGYADAMDSIVRCAECGKEGTEACPMVHRDGLLGNLFAENKGDDFCSRGERRKEKEDGE